VQQAVEPPIAFVDGLGDRLVVGRQRAFQVQRHDAGFRRSEPSCR
jgi:hypothetical protein